MSKLALLILIISLLISKNAIEGDGYVNHRSPQSGNIQTMQPVIYFGNHLSRDEPINYSGNKGKMKRRKRTTDDGNDQSDILFDNVRQSYLHQKRHQPLNSRPDPEIILTAEKRKFSKGFSKNIL
jgi:hypothetical protein